MNWFWHALWICLFVIPITILWGVCIFDLVWRRRDLVWWKRLAWLVLVLVLPVIGALIYASSSFAAKTETDYRDQRDLEQLRSGGALTEAEYEQQRDTLDSQRWH
jgi:hypothetical protein